MIRRTAKAQEGAVSVEFTNLLAANPLELRPRQFPRFDPFLAERDLFGRPICQSARFVVHPASLANRTAVDNVTMRPGGQCVPQWALRLSMNRTSPITGSWLQCAL